MKNKNTIIASLIVIILAIAGFFGYKAYINSKSVEGTKEYTVIVRDTNNTFNNEYKFKTDETSLGKDLSDRNLITTEQSSGMTFVTGVDGREADQSKQEWWNLKINGEDSMVNVDDVMIVNGDKVEFVLTTGW